MRYVTVAALAFAFLVAWPADAQQVLVGTIEEPRGRADRRGDFPRPNRGDDPEAGELRHQAHALRPRQSQSRHRRGSAVDQGGAGILCKRVRRPADCRGGSEPDLAGYRVVWRPTHQPFWTRGLDVPSDKPTDTVEAIVKGLSKDDLFFAVQAVDRDGNASLPTFPVPPSIRPTS